ncbi:hypothetical protein KAU39_02900 [bacterium]|nr:hypothetical protein [bacterium]
MKKLFKRKERSKKEQNEPDFLSLLQEIQQQLVFLEKKIDALSGQPQKRNREHSYSRDRNDRKSGFREKSFTKAICSQCHKECEVPFKPTDNRPVYCSDCFSKRGEGGSFEGKRDRKPRSGGFDRESHSGRYFDKREDGESRGFGKIKPTSFRKRKKKV